MRWNDENRGDRKDEWWVWKIKSNPVTFLDNSLTITQADFCIAQYVPRHTLVWLGVTFSFYAGTVSCFVSSRFRFKNTVELIYWKLILKAVSLIFSPCTGTVHVPITLPKIYKTTFFTISNFCRWNLEFAREKDTRENNRLFVFTIDPAEGTDRTTRGSHFEGNEGRSCEKRTVPGTGSSWDWEWGSGRWCHGIFALISAIESSHSVNFIGTGTSDSPASHPIPHPVPGRQSISAGYRFACKMASTMLATERFVFYRSVHALLTCYWLLKWQERWIKLTIFIRIESLLPSITSC